LQAAFSTSEDTICVGSPITFTNNSTATSGQGIDPSYYWDFGDDYTDNVKNPVHQFTKAGTFRTMLVAKNFVPCQDTAYKLIYVDSLPGLSFTQNLREICMGDQVFFTADYVHNGLKDLEWNFGYSGDTVFNVNPAHASFDAPGTYTITLHADYRVCPDTSYRSSVTVNPIPAINIGPDTAMCLDGEPIFLQDKVNSGNLNAHWLWNTGDTTSSIMVKHYGLYHAKVTIDHCSATDEVNVDKDCYIDIPNSFTPNGDGENDYFFPRQYLSHGAVGFSMSIYNRWGEKIFETQNPTGRGWDGTFNGKAQPVGVYIYQVRAVMKNGHEEKYSGNITLLR
jgi:gliding motility-associated-like protein